MRKGQLLEANMTIIHFTFTLQFTLNSCSAVILSLGKITMLWPNFNRWPMNTSCPGKGALTRECESMVKEYLGPSWTPVSHLASSHLASCHSAHHTLLQVTQVTPCSGHTHMQQACTAMQIAYVCRPVRPQQATRGRLL